ncbi:MAG: ABC transporter ATP-binding protein [Oscillospiraceae bacterium]|jgi:peptide/nickel transport system ATP-binding protein
MDTKVEMIQAETQKNESAMISVRDLVVHYEMDDGVVEAVNGVSFDISKGETLGLVGETGAGKTSIALSITGLLSSPPANILEGSIMFQGRDLLKMSHKELRSIRGSKISMIFQDPMTALNPVQKVGDQIAEVIKLHNKGKNKKYVQLLAADMLKTVGIQPERYEDYPHQFSGGMKQRVVIAMALACNPELIIADEPTTALDVTIQAQILDLIKKLQKERNTSMLLITHDFGVVAEVCDKCAVIYAGEIVEYGTVAHIFNNPMHPYTIGLFDSLPSIDDETERLKPIQGQVTDPMDLHPYCSFADRCDVCQEKCREKDPVLIEAEPGHLVKCLKFEKEAAEDGAAGG